MGYMVIWLRSPSLLPSCSIIIIIITIITISLYITIILIITLKSFYLSTSKSLHLQFYIYNDTMIQ